MKALALLAVAVAGSITATCGGEPLAPPSAQLLPVASDLQGMVKTPISGTFEPPHDGTTGENIVLTPSGRCHISGGGINVFQITGSLQGEMTAHYEPENYPCDFVAPGSRLTAAGPSDGTVTFDGTTGPVTGHWNTECRPGDTVTGLACDGVMNLRGQGALEGVQFHLEWGTGWWPFDYVGTAFTPFSG